MNYIDPNINNEIPDMTHYTHENISNHIPKNNDYLKRVTKDILHGLAKNDINLSENSSQKSNNSIEEISQKKEHFAVEKSNIKNTVLQYIIDFATILFIYVILSLDTVKDFFGNYLIYINPDEEGKTGIIGVLSYGILLALLIIIAKIILSFF